MNDQKNIFLAIGFSILIIIFFQIFFPQPTMVQQNERLAKEENRDETNQSNILNEQIDSNKEIIKSKDEIISANNKRVKIDTKSLKGSINLVGGFLDDITLKNYKESLDNNSNNIDLLNPDNTNYPYFIEFKWISNNSEIEMPNENTLWETNNELLDANNPVILKWKNNHNITFNLIFEIDDDYMFSINQKVENNSNKEINIRAYRTIKRINKPKTIDFFILHEGIIGVSSERLWTEKYKTIKKECSDNEDIKKEYCEQKLVGGWSGFTDKYWMTALIAENNDIDISYKHYNKGRDIFIARHLDKPTNLNKNSEYNFNGNVFTGAKVLRILNVYEEKFNITRFNDAIDWGMFSFLTKPIFYSINWFFGIVGNFGIAIIAFTFLMRLFLFPLAQSSFKSMAKMKKLQPEMQRLKEIYPDDRQKMQQELMALYKKEGANPIAGCLPIFLQIPIFFSLYKVLFVTIEMYHAPFYGWINDLSAPDPLGILTIFGLIQWDVWPQLSIINIGILPILMGFTMWLQQKLNPAPADPTQARIFAILPFVFTFVLAGFAAGLVLYWTVNNILSIAQQWIIQRKILNTNEKG
ncbi:MAG: Membrane protein insertase YidC [Alphaproteobacteria bacterium MarineAlpha5_Bin9]|nr:MAG: Membrane protein insertase YidC [Alphaproteobacteria bacterium MarineAlpha5_Bin9]|tara:strand:+ start:94 stop:1839 length:1746 start_codon:yes stop_codon:yes gene_type:complete